MKLIGQSTRNYLCLIQLNNSSPSFIWPCSSHTDSSLAHSRTGQILTSTYTKKEVHVSRSSHKNTNKLVSQQTTNPIQLLLMKMKLRMQDLKEQSQILPPNSKNLKNKRTNISLNSKRITMSAKVIDITDRDKVIPH